MKISDFQKGVDITFNHKNYELDLLHCTIGLQTEIGELFESPSEDLINQKEELGDVYWYLAAIGNVEHLKFEVEDAIYPIPNLPELYITKSKNLDGLVVESGKLADLIKRHVYYGEPLDINLLKVRLNNVWQLLSLMGLRIEVMDSDCMESNQSKLRKRFSGKFDAHEALNRNLDSERKALEGNE